MAQFARLIPLLAIVTVLAGPALARCQGMVVLMGLHDNYRATIFETGETQARSAKALLVTAGGLSAGRLTEQVAESGTVLDAGRLETVLEDAADIGASVLLGPLENYHFKHSQNVDWLARKVASSRCSNSFAASDRIPVSAPTSVSTATKGRLETFLESERAAPFAALVGLTVLISLGYAITAIRRSIGFKKRAVARLPRQALGLEVPITFTDSDGNMQQHRADCVDISVGGLKLRWDDPPEQGALVTVSLDIGECLGTIVWSNQFYAGVAFETMISKSDLAQLIEDNTAPAQN